MCPRGGFRAEGVTIDDVRELVLSLPETTEAPHHEMSSFRVRRKIFATVPPDGEHLHVFVDEDRVRAAVAHESGAREELYWGKKLYGVRVYLPTAESGMVLDLVEEAWRGKAPKALADRH